MPKNDIQLEKTLSIRSFGRERTFRIAAWKYWEIVDELISRGIKREEAYAAAEWASKIRTKGRYTDIPNLILIVE